MSCNLGAVIAHVLSDIIFHTHITFDTHTFWIQTFFWPVKVDFVTCFCHFALLRHRSKLPTYFVES